MNQYNIRKLRETGVFLKAKGFHLKNIEISQELAKARGKEYPFDELADMKEVLADILIECDTTDTDLEAKEVLQQLLEAEVSRPVEQRSGVRRCRLYHKLGGLYFKQNNVNKARTFLKRAFEGRKQMDPRPDEDIAESAELLIKIHQSLSAFGEARALQEWMRRELRRTSEIGSITTIAEDVGVNLPNAYQWCMDRGLCVSDPNFRFDVCDSEGTTPLHRAIEANGLDVLRDMLPHVQHVEQRDASYSTPLHQAATKKNRHIVNLLLEAPHNANPNVQDRNGMSPLHRCQSTEGGVRAAELLLNKCPELVDQLDNHNKTALYMACLMGNVKMVGYLLKTDPNANPPKAGADPNIKGPAGCTPLVAVMEATMPPRPKYTIVKLLLNSGANPRIQDRDGRSAIDAANNAGLLSSEIKKLLRDALADFSRRGSASSFANTIGTSSSGVARTSGSR